MLDLATPLPMKSSECCLAVRAQICFRLFSAFGQHILKANDLGSALDEGIQFSFH